MPKSIEVIGHVDEQHRISAQAPSDIPPGFVKLTLQTLSNPGKEDELTGGQWAAAVAREWLDELADSRQDIYSLADGEPVNERR